MCTAKNKMRKESAVPNVAFNKKNLYEIDWNQLQDHSGKLGKTTATRAGATFAANREVPKTYLYHQFFKASQENLLVAFVGM